MNPQDITAELRDLKPPVEIPEVAGHSPWPIVGGVIGGLIIVVLAWWWFARRSRKTPPVDSVKVALQDLRKANHEHLQEESDRYAMALSDVLRRYLENHLEVISVRQTTDDFLQSLADSKGGPLRKHRSTLAAFLRQCDLVKFAREELSEAQRDGLYQSALTFIQTTAAELTELNKNKEAA